VPTHADAPSISLRKGLYKRASPERFNGGGSLIKQTVNEITRSVVAAPILRVWPALLATYEQLGIRPTVSDRAAGLYGNRSFVFPARLRETSTSAITCESTGALKAFVHSEIARELR